MISVKQAATRAFQYIISLYSSLKLTDLEVEEVELSEDEKFWLLTIGMPDTKSVSPLSVMTNPRKYKIIRVDSETGEIKSMKIRKL